MNVPNHAQAARIASDLNKLARGESASDWQGNSYRGIVGYAPESGHYYTLIHWSTPICQIAVHKGKVVVMMFNARYISSTTRSFQGRILSALRRVHDARTNDLTAIGDELSRSTGERQLLCAEDSYPHNLTR